jgi:hypothetical protein
MTAADRAKAAEVYCGGRGCVDPACGCDGPTETLTRYQNAALDMLELREHSGVTSSYVSLPGFLWQKVDRVAAALAERDAAARADAEAERDRLVAAVQGLAEEFYQSDMAEREWVYARLCELIAASKEATA